MFTACDREGEASSRDGCYCSCTLQPNVLNLECSSKILSKPHDKTPVVKFLTDLSLYMLIEARIC